MKETTHKTFMHFDPIKERKEKATIIKHYDRGYTVYNSPETRYIESADGFFHLYFRKKDGLTLKWGAKLYDDPPFCPFGNEIADIEITKACRGIRDAKGERHPCRFCVPAGTSIKTPNGDVSIEDITKGDYVLGYDFERKSLQVQEVQELYVREYAGDLISVSLEDGTSLELTPNHPVMLSDGKQVPAGELKDIDEIVCW